MQCVSTGKLSTDEIVATTKTMSKNITCLENYVQAMNSLQLLSDLEIKRANKSLSRFISELKATADIVANAKGISIIKHTAAEFLMIDSEVVMQVCENLIANAARFAKT